MKNEKLVQPIKAVKKKKRFSVILETIADICRPLIPLLLATGLVRILNILITAVGYSLNMPLGDFAMLSIIGNMVTYFFPFLLALSAAKKFQTSEWLALSLVAGYMYVPILNQTLNFGENSENSLRFFGLPILPIDYKSAILSVILSVWLLSHLEKWLNKRLPDFLKMIGIPVIVLLIMIPLQLMVIGPIFPYLGKHMVRLLHAIGGVVCTFMLSGLNPLLPMLSVEEVIKPMQMQELFNGGSALLVGGLTAILAQAGAALGVFLRVENKSEKSLAILSAISACLGIVEPAVLGVNLKYKRPFGFALLSAAVGAVFLSFFDTKLLAHLQPSLLNLPLIETDSFFALVVGLVISAGSACALTYFFGLPESTQKASVTKSNK